MASPAAASEWCGSITISSSQAGRLIGGAMPLSRLLIRCVTALGGLFAAAGIMIFCARLDIGRRTRSKRLTTARRGRHDECLFAVFNISDQLLAVTDGDFTCRDDRIGHRAVGHQIHDDGLRGAGIASGKI